MILYAFLLRTAWASNGEQFRPVLISLTNLASRVFESRRLSVFRFLFRTPIKDSFLTVYFSLIITHTTGVTYVRMMYTVTKKCIDHITLLGIKKGRQLSQADSLLARLYRRICHDKVWHSNTNYAIIVLGVP